jgi:hypothetical protein
LQPEDIKGAQYSKLKNENIDNGFTFDKTLDYLFEFLKVGWLMGY